jgi:Xaa-Pro aminopeptidase
MADRVGRLLGLLDTDGLDALLVTSLPNVRYLTGFTGSNGLAVIGPQTRTFVTDFRYVEQSAAEVDPSFERPPDTAELLDAVPAALPAGELRLGFDDAEISVQRYNRLRGLLPGRVELVAAGGLVEQLRQVKDADEVERIRAATVAADTAFMRLLDQGLIGRSERQLARALEDGMRDVGVPRPSFETIVAAGPHGALPHAAPGEETVREGQMVVIDWGAELDGYCSDCTRTIAAGKPSAEAREVYELVLSAQLTGLGSARAGAGGRAVDAASRAVIEAAGHGEHFGHGLGHGVGIETHEGPRVSKRSEDQLASGNVITVEPGVYLPGRFGVRIEDLVLVGEAGCEILTGCDKALTVVD